ncbi:MAG: DNA recombination protein RmuC, partial [Luteibaculum sp.]
MDLLFLILGLAVGAALGYFIANRKGAGAQIDFNHWVEKSVLEAEKQQRHELQKRNDQLQQQVLGLNSENAGLKSRLQSLQEKLEEQKDELNRLNERFKNEFQVLANEILEEKSKKFVDINNEKLEILLNPLKEKITAFEKQVAEAYEKETKEKTALKFELDKIVEMNRKMSEEAERLTNALKGDSKYQGDWGEIQLERILERAGLEEGIHFETQGNYKNEQGQNIR